VSREGSGKERRGKKPRVERQVTVAAGLKIPGALGRDWGKESEGGRASGSPS